MSERQPLTMTELHKVPIHHFVKAKHDEFMSPNQPLHSSSKKDVLGVCLWGPPGSGKSSAPAHIQFLLGEDHILMFDNDAWSDYWLKHLFPVTYETFL